MIQTKVKGQAIKEDTDRSNEIQYTIEEQLAMLAVYFHFNWTAPLHDIVRRLMNEVYEFVPLKEDEP